jgi:hypothetical protein
MTNTSPLATHRNDDFDHVLQQAMDAAEGGQMEAANQCLLQAMQLQPGSATPHFLLGANCAQSGLNDQAEAAFIACLSRAPDFLIARFQLGLLQLTNSRAATAHATWEPLLALGDDHYLKLFVQGFLAILHADKGAAQDFICRGIALNSEIPPLNRDMQGVLGRLDALVAEPETSPPVAPPDVPAGDQPGSNHFLISSYGKG